MTFYKQKIKSFLGEYSQKIFSMFLSKMFFHNCQKGFIIFFLYDKLNKPFYIYYEVKRRLLYSINYIKLTYTFSSLFVFYSLEYTFLFFHNDPLIYFHTFLLVMFLFFVLCAEALSNIISLFRNLFVILCSKNSIN